MLRLLGGVNKADGAEQKARAGRCDAGRYA
jgi:hypothetical protein